MTSTPKSSGAAISGARNSSPALGPGSLPAGESDPSVTLDSGAGEAKRGRGRPRILGPRPWDLEGISKSTWHRNLRRQKEAGK